MAKKMDESPAKPGNADDENDCVRAEPIGDDEGAAVGAGGVESQGLRELADCRPPMFPALSIAPKAPPPTELRPGGEWALLPGAVRVPEPLIADSRDMVGEERDESAAEYDDSADWSSAARPDDGGRTADADADADADAVMEGRCRDERFCQKSEPAGSPTPARSTPTPTGTSIPKEAIADDIAGEVGSAEYGAPADGGPLVKDDVDPWKKSCCMCCEFGGDMLPTKAVGTPLGLPPGGC